MVGEWVLERTPAIFSIVAASIISRKLRSQDCSGIQRERNVRRWKPLLEVTDEDENAGVVNCGGYGLLKGL